MIFENFYTELPLTKGRTTLVDKDVPMLLGNKKAHAWTDGKRTYARIAIARKTYPLARFILGLERKDPRCADHINHDTLDNRRENLRIVTTSQNQMNTVLRVDNASGAKGVSYGKRQKAWGAYINKQGKRTFLGWYKDRNAAVAVRKEAEQAFFNIYACGVV